jgi:uncharacterized protein YyaL (SSP411 family)
VPNRLANETSPYLLQHANDPVDWYPWGEEAFARARDLSRPIFLSIGYSSCHWCHVMQRESFSDPTTAEVLNEFFVPVKVDRECRPDVDDLYMTYVVMANGHGGWPMSVFLTPQLLPLYGGTYFPAEPTHDTLSFLQVLDTVASAFGDRPSVASSTAQEAVEYLRSLLEPPLPDEITRSVLYGSVDRILRASDAVNGGFGSAPKFPQWPVIEFLIAYHRLTGDERALDTAEHALRGIVRGGIFDQAGGGVARYAVDDAWLVPHFEKMLYDNGQLLSVLAAVHDVRPDAEWEHAMRTTAAFLDRELASPEGFFYSSLSADDELGVEGGAYVWTRSELASFLSAEELALAESALGVKAEGNWDGQNVLTRQHGREHAADAVDALLERILSQRQERSPHLTDTKILVDWNALAARGLLRAGTALNDTALVERGLRLARSLAECAADPNGGVVHVLGDSSSADVRLADDAIALGYALATAFQVTGDKQDRELARQVLEHADDLFAERGVWYMTPALSELPLRPLALRDGAVPATGALAALASIALWRCDGDETFRWHAEDALERLVTTAEGSPFHSGAALAGIATLYLAGR